MRLLGNDIVVCLSEQNLRNLLKVVGKIGELRTISKRMGDGTRLFVCAQTDKEHYEEQEEAMVVSKLRQLPLFGEEDRE